MDYTQSIYCNDKCCEIVQTMKQIQEPPHFLTDRTKRDKTGVIIINAENKILLSQSYNGCWGVPKGSKEPFENFEEAAIRETKEETGILVPYECFEYSRAHVYVLHKHVFVMFMLKLKNKGPMAAKNPHLLGTESTGCGWINLNCLHTLHKQKKIRLNCITKLILKRNFALNF